MGIFYKKHVPDESEPAYDPVHLATAALASCDDPALSLALVISQLLQQQVVSVDDLLKVGISQDEVVAIVAAYSESATREEFDRALEVQAALRQYNADLAAIAGDRGISTSSDTYVVLRSAIATFAEENNILDLKVAYRLMLAECPERLPV